MLLLLQPNLSVVADVVVSYVWDLSSSIGVHKVEQANRLDVNKVTHDDEYTDNKAPWPPAAP